MKTVFTKYSTERSPEYAIKTVILSDDEGNLQVRKCPSSEEALPHVKKMLESYDKINSVYAEAGIRASKISPCDEGVVFEFEKGISLEEKLEDVEKEKGISGVFELIYSFKNSLFTISSITDFKRCGAFDEIFGTEPLPVGLHSTDFSCFDMAFGNLIENEKGITVIDYEWCFDFPIPVEYIVYRAVKLYVLLNNKQELIRKDIMGYLGFDERLREAFDRLEESFQSYVERGCYSLRELYGAFDTKRVFLGDALAAVDRAPKNALYQVYLDYGRGFNEEDSYKKAYIGDELSSEIVLTGDVKACRFDPCEDCCVAVGVEISADTNEGRYEPECITNGLKKGQVIYFVNEDPQIIFTDIKPNTSVIRIKCRIIETDKYQTDVLAKTIYENFDKQRLIDGYKHDINQHLATVSRLDGELNEQKSVNAALEEQKRCIEAELEAKAAALKAELEKNRAELEAKDQYITAIEQSKAWKAVCKIRKIFGR